MHSSRSRTARRRTSPRALLGAAALLLIALPCAAQWKWRDADGRIQYSDRPPPASVPDRHILQQPPRATAPAVVASRPAASAAASAQPAASAVVQTDATLEARKRQALAAEEAQRRAEEQKLARQRADNCQRARDYARTLQSGVRISRITASGEREFLSDEQRAAETRRAQGLIASECS
ncbi:uncharacterized protein DUF4124 [Sphaerotilus hippei]|uniref:Uncharacterized protein DUF4124 n=1 Tax=Sphaerotilus hippei TaxID=744406 RepID=A0A318GYR9_9BURK|nr:DUF4124 domain-containing protein [Sphaerotilus hippei]PXW95287.1 uncharacterized protein DUF4124 [Sphaerotilus hippei]